MQPWGPPASQEQGGGWRAEPEEGGAEGKAGGPAESGKEDRKGRSWQEQQMRVVSSKAGRAPVCEAVGAGLASPGRRRPQAAFSPCGWLATRASPVPWASSSLLSEMG